MELAEPERLALSFPWGSESVRVTAYAPDGSVAVELTPNRLCVWLDAEPGIWILSARSASPEITEGTFDIAFDELYEY